MTHGLVYGIKTNCKLIKVKSSKIVLIFYSSRVLSHFIVLRNDIKNYKQITKKLITQNTNN